MMKTFRIGAAIALTVLIGGQQAAAQETKVKTQTTVESSEGAQTTTRTTTIFGDVIRYEPGKTIVLRHPDSRIVTYALNPSLTVPVEVQIGRSVSIETAPSEGGVLHVTRITTVTPATATSGARTTTVTKTTTLTGDLVRYEPGRLIAVRQPEGQVVTYMLAPTLTVPAEIQIGGKISFVTEPSVAGQTLVTRITTVKTETADEAAGPSASTRETTVPSSAEGTMTTPTTTTFAGEIVTYEPGQTIVLKQPDSQVVTYTIGPSAVVPAEAQIGRRVSIVTEVSPSGTLLVTSVTPEEATQITTAYGTVTAYEPGRKVTVIQPDKKTVTYVVDSASEVPKDFAVGKKVTIHTTRMTGSEMPVVRKVIYATRTKTTKKKS